MTGGAVALILFLTAAPAREMWTHGDRLAAACMVTIGLALAGCLVAASVTLR